MRCTQAIEAGAYVLGALAPAERSLYQRHMAGCADCRDEVADLAGLPGLLARLDEATAVAIAGRPIAPAAAPEQDTDETVALHPIPTSLLPGVLAKARAQRSRERRRGRWRVAAAVLAAACLAVVAWVGATAVRPPPERVQVASPPPVVVLAPMDAVKPGVPVTAVIGFRAAAGGGTDIQMSCLYTDSSPDAKAWTFKLVVYPRRGAAGEMVREWAANPSEYREIGGHSTLAPQDIDRIEVQLLSGARLLVYQPT